MDVGQRAFGSHAHGGFQVGFGLIHCVAALLHNGAPNIAVDKARRRRDRLVGHLAQQIHIAALGCDTRQFLLCIQRRRIQIFRLTKALFSQGAIALGLRGLAQPELQEGVLGVILGGILQGIHGIARLAIVQQYDSVQSGHFRILGIVLHQPGNHGLCGGKILDLKKNANVSLLHRSIFGILGGQG